MLIKKYKKIKNGFSLIELLVVVLIIGILSAILLPQYERVIAKTRLATAKSKARSLYDAVGRYYLANGKYTANLADLDIEVGEVDPNSPSKTITQNGTYCYINPNHSCGCFIRVYNNIAINYYIFRDMFYCLSYSKDVNDKANKLCQLEAGSTNPADITNSSYNAYMYE